MAIYSMNLSCMQIADMLIQEAARISLNLNFHRATGPGEDSQARRKVFWVVYSLEKLSSFTSGVASVHSPPE
jgi:hypothetical protein